MDIKVSGVSIPSSYPVQASTSHTIESNTEQPVSKDVSEKQYSREHLEQQVDVFNKMLQTNQAHVKFVLHDQLGEYYVQVINDKTSEVIREIPTKKMMDTVAKMYEMIGILVDQKR
jgi:flagellar protein FlaG